MSWDIESNDAPLAGCLLYMAGIFNRCHGTHFCYSLEEASDVFFFFFFIPSIPPLFFWCLGLSRVVVTRDY